MGMFFAGVAATLLVEAVVVIGYMLWLRHGGINVL